MKNIEDFLSYLGDRNIKIWADGDRLHCNAPKGILTPILRAELAERKAEIIAFLRNIDAISSSTISPIPKVSRDSNLPLSFAQQRLWFLDQLEVGSNIYKRLTALQFIGSLNIAALEQSLTEIVRRHEILRTNFVVINGSPVQVISPPFTINLPVIDLQSLSEFEQSAKIRELATKEVEYPFDLVNGRLLRVTLLQLGLKSHIILLVIHHIISDGWSESIFNNEVTTLYNAFSTGNDSPLPELSIQYADFAHWQRQWMSGKVLNEQLKYWKQQLAGATSLLELPTDQQRPTIQTFQYAREGFQLKPQLARQLKTMSQRLGTTLFMFLLAAFSILLSRYSGQLDIVIGSPIANRNRREIEGLIGYFVNGLALRIDLQSNPTCQEMLHRVRQVALDAFDHQDIPFEQLVEALQPERSLSHNPLFQVLFVLKNEEMEKLELPGLTINLLEMESITANLDLNLIIENTDSQLLRGVFEYNTDLFDASTISRMAGHFQTLLEEIVANPQQKISELPLLTEAERHHLLVEWNNSQADYPKDKCIHQLFEEQVEKTPDTVAVVFEGEKLTYRELNNRANRLARILVEQGVKSDSIVGLFAERGINFLTAMIAVFKAGGAYLPIDPNHPPQRINQIIDHSMPPLILVASNFEFYLLEAIEKLPLEKQPIVLQIEELLARVQSEENLAISCTPKNLAYVIYTSGSTGIPKGVMIEHKGMLNHLYAKIFDLKLTDTDIVAQNARQSFDISVWQFLGVLLVGGCVHIFNNEIAINPKQLLEQVECQRISVLEIVPSMLRVIIEEITLRGSNRPTLSKLRWLMLTGEALPPKLCRQWLDYYPAIPMMNAYGPTECSDDVAHYPIYLPPDPELLNMPIGRPVANMQLYILDSQLKPVPIGITSELYVGGIGVGRGYLNSPELTAKSFIPNPFNKEQGSLLYKTGDSARYKLDGNIEFLGRLDNQVKVRGFRIELGEIEAVLNQHPTVEEAVVLTRENEAEEQQIIAYVVQNSQYQVSEKQGTKNNKETKQTNQWEVIFDDVYSQRGSLGAWISSYTDESYPEAEVFEAVNDAVKRILELKPNQVLEIGCGQGLLLSKIAPYCSSYWGTDLSQEAIDYLQKQLDIHQGYLPEITLLKRDADDFDGIPLQTFDVVIINEVAQYFPSIEYLVRVLEKAIKVLQKGGFIFIGGVRNLSLLQSFHTSVQLHQSSSSFSLDKLKERIQKNIAQEKELVVEPSFWEALQQHIPQISNLQIQLKGGNYINEITKYRYDVILSIEKEFEIIADYQRLDWEPMITLAYIQKLLLDTSPDILVVFSVPNARLVSDQKILELLAKSEDWITVGQLLEGLEEAIVDTDALNPEHLWKLGSDLFYDVNLSWSDCSVNGCYDVVFTLSSIATENMKLVLEKSKKVHIPHSWNDYANNPLQYTLIDSIPEWRSWLREKLPEYMIPSSFVILGEMPLTPNGKIDRHALCLLDTSIESPEDNFVSPRTLTEKVIATIWAEVLQVKKVGIYDNFFNLGGHSLMAIQVISRIRESLQIDLSIRSLFEFPTIAELAKFIDIKQIEQSDNEELQKILSEVNDVSDDEINQKLAED